MMKPTERDFEYFLEIQEDLAREHDGKFVAIKGQEVLGIFADYLEAANTVYVEHERGTVLMQPISSDPSANTIVVNPPRVPVIE